MEISSTDSSDKDKNMQNSFEKYLDDEKDTKTEKSKKTSSQKASGSSFEKSARAVESQDKDDAKKPPDFLKSLLNTHVDKEEVSHTKPEILPSSGEDIVNVEHASLPELNYAANAYLEERRVELNSELAEVEPGGEEEIEAAADSAFLESLQEQIDSGTDIEVALDLAETEVLAEINELAGVELGNEESEETDAFEGAEEQEDSEDGLPPTTPTNTSVSSAGPPSLQPPSPPPNSNGTGGPGGSIPPNNPPNTPNMPNEPNQPNVIQTPVYVDRIVPMPVPVERHGIRPRDALIGGVIGYFIGRRKGRINTEAKLIPVQEKLQKEVEELHQTIADKEAHIRKTAREKLSPALAVTAEMQPPITASSLENKTYAPVESKDIKRSELSFNNKEKPIDVSLAPLREVLALAASVEVAGKSMKSLFEQGKLTEQELRRIVGEHERGASIESIRPYIIETEQNSFENPASYNDTALEPTRDNKPAPKHGSVDGHGFTGSVASNSQSPDHVTSSAQQFYPEGNMTLKPESITPPQKPKSHLPVTVVAVAVAIALGLIVWLN